MISSRIQVERSVLKYLYLVDGAFRDLPQEFTDDAFECQEHKELYRRAIRFYRSGLPVDCHEVGSDPKLGPLIQDIVAMSTSLDGVFAQVTAGLVKHDEPVSLEAADFQEMTVEDLRRVLGLTIRADDTNKVVCFLVMLSGASENSQLNLSFNAPSASGKSYIPTEISQIFPPESVLMLGYCSPTSFFHDASYFDKDRGCSVVDLERRVVIFLDQPHQELLARLRPVLSHDRKEILSKITDRTQKSGQRTKNVLIRGYFAAVFCSSSLKFDEQEATRQILLSPETSQEKLRAGILEKIRKETDPAEYAADIESDLERIRLKERVRAVWNARVREIKLHDPHAVEEAFLGMHRTLKPRHQRDIGRIIGLVKTIALLNLWHRGWDGSSITTRPSDLKQALELWAGIARSQELNLPPYIFELYERVFVPAYRETPKGITRRQLGKKHLEVYDRPIQDWILRTQILPMMENSGLIYQEPDPEDRRRTLIHVIVEEGNAEDQY